MPNAFFTFLLLISQISSKTRKSDFAKQKISSEKTLAFFSHIRHEGFPVDLLRKNFLTHSKSFCFFKKELVDLKGLTPGMLVTLGEKKILTLQDFADLSSDELTGAYDMFKGERVKIKGYLEEFALNKTEADELIMSAREIVYKN